MKKKIHIVLLAVAVMMLFSFIIPNYSYGFDGGSLLSPIMKFFVAICDAIVDIFQKVLLGIEDDAFWQVDRTADLWSIIWGTLAVILVVGISVALAVFFAPVTGTAALIFVGVKTAIISIGKAVITYFVVSTIVAGMLPDTFYLPFISISPENILQNKISVFNVNFFEETDGSEYEVNALNIANDLHGIVAKWFYALRTVVIVCFMVVLLYLGIRIMLTSISSEKAQYKNMLMDWFVAICLLFVIHYIMIFSMQVVDAFTKLIGGALEENSVEYFEIQDDKVYDYVKENLDKIEKTDSISSDSATPIEGGEEYTTLYIKDGKKTVRFPVDNFMAQARIKMQLLDEEGEEKYESISWSIIYIMLTLYTIKFAYIYLKRVVYIGFLIIVSPLVVLTYPIDKLNDGSAQGFNTWLKEYLFNLAIQPFHLLLYTVFIGSAMSLASNNPIYVLVVMGFITPAEKILRKMFGFEKAATPGILEGSIGTGLAMAGIQKLFGKKPEHINMKSNSHNADNSEKKDSKLREQDVDDILGDGDTDDAEIIPAKLDAPKQPDSMEENLELLDTDNKNKTIEERAEEAALDLEVSALELAKMSDSQKSHKKKKRKFKIRKAIKGAVRHYVQTKGRRLAEKANSTSLVRGATKVVAGSVAAITAGAAGILLGAVDGSLEKSARNASVLGTVAYKGTSGSIDAGRVDGMWDSFIKAGYGSEYKKHKEEILTRQLKHDLELKTILEDELRYDSKQIQEFFENTIDEYIKEGVKNIDDMIIGEKLKLDKITETTKQSIGIMYLGQQIGTDTRNLTKKQRREWAETIISKSSGMSKMQERMKELEYNYEKQIKEIQKMKLDKEREEQRISQIREQREADKELKELTQCVNLVKTETLKKLDRYSKYKYK